MILNIKLSESLREFARETLQLTRTQVEVLLKLIFHWNSQTGQCNPKLETIASEVGCDEKSVRRAVNRFHDEKIMLKGKGVWGRNLYHPGDLISAQLGLNVQSAPDKMSGHGGQNVRSCRTKCPVTTEHLKNEQYKKEQTSSVELSIPSWTQEKVRKLAFAFGNQVSATDRTFLERDFVMKEVTEFELVRVVDAVEKRKRTVKNPVGYILGILANIRRQDQRTVFAPKEAAPLEQLTKNIGNLGERKTADPWTLKKRLFDELKKEKATA